MVNLLLDEELLASCVACGLCLPHCPTYRVTGDELASPRGRIAAMRAVHAGAVAADATFRDAMESCVQCRGCEPACPSGVRFGHLMEQTREALARSGGPPWWQRLGYRLLARHRLLLALSSVLAVLQRARLVPRRLGLPPIPLRRRRLAASGADAWLLTGCVMDAWMRPTHAAAQRVMEATGAGVQPTPPGAACCGALHLHAGLRDEARALARRVIAALPGDAAVVVDAAGCGAMLKGYGELLGTAEAVRFSARVQDVHEWLAGRLERLPSAPNGARPVVAVQDPCHLRHVQRAHHHVRSVLAPFAEVVELGTDGLCCGAGGAYAALHPGTSEQVRDITVRAARRTGAPVVASPNPGCAMHLSAAGLTVRHPIEIVDEVLHGR